MLTVAKPAGSSGSSEGFIGDKVDEKKRRRMESNRESARRSRQRKQQHLDDLIKISGKLTRENEEFGRKIDEFTTGLTAIESQNSVLKSEKDRLAARLVALENVIHISKVVRGSSTTSSFGKIHQKNNINQTNDNQQMNHCNEGSFCEMMMMNDDPMMKPWQLRNHSSLPVISSSRFQY